jgi:hypothetical protein
MKYKASRIHARSAGGNAIVQRGIALADGKKAPFVQSRKRNGTARRLCHFEISEKTPCLVADGGLDERDVRRHKPCHINSLRSDHFDPTDPMKEL